jgi:hypothetical protein
MAMSLTAVRFAILSVLFIPLFIVFGARDASAGAAPCDIQVMLETIPEDDTEFEYDLSADIESGFTLSDPSDNTTNFGMGIDQFVVLSQLTPPGWQLLEIICVEGTTNCGSEGFEPCLSASIQGNSVAFGCLDNDTASCTFINAPAGASVSSIPTLSEWGLMATALFLGIAALFVLRKKKALHSS